MIKGIGITVCTVVLSLLVGLVIIAIVQLNLDPSAKKLVMHDKNIQAYVVRVSEGQRLLLQVSEACSTVCIKEEEGVKVWVQVKSDVTYPSDLSSQLKRQWKKHLLGEQVYAVLDRKSPFSDAANADVYFNGQSILTMTSKMK